jgi:hypothetical protein
MLLLLFQPLANGGHANFLESLWGARSLRVSAGRCRDCANGGAERLRKVKGER